jgi:hypothetical protein
VELLNERSTVEAGEEGDEVFDWRAELKLMEEENKKNQVTPPPPSPQAQYKGIPLEMNES